MTELLTVDEALDRIVAHAQLLPVEQVAVGGASGRVLREPATAYVDLPPFPSSAMDGFAIRAADAPGELPVAFRVAAGAPPPGPLPVGSGQWDLHGRARCPPRPTRSSRSSSSRIAGATS